jgi:perosamine synthetase
MVSQQISTAPSAALEHPIRSRPKIPLMRPIIDEEMIQAAIDALRNERLVHGESVFKFEEEFARYCGTRHAISTSSGTAALQIALQSLGIGAGDSVITTPFTFIASSNAVIHAGARPEFADVEKTGFNLDPVQVEKKIGKETKGILPVHLYGQPARMKEFRELASEHEIRLVEDACQAHGSEIRGKRAGSMGDVGCFSFYTSKNMTVAGDGGMIVTDDDRVAENARSLRDCGRASKYTMSRIGYTSRLNTVNAAIGRVQLRKLDRWNLVRRRLASRYRKGLQDVAGITLPPEDNPGSKSVYHLFVIRSKNRDELAKKLEANGVETAVHYPIPSHLQAPYREMYGYSEGLFPISERLAGEVLSLPLWPEMADEDVDRVCQLIRDNSTGQA